MFQVKKDKKQDAKKKDSVQRKQQEKYSAARPNFTEIPDEMKADFENTSGFSFDDVRVHYNSGKPAHLQALAYAQGNQVFLAPGQEQHLGHELGHVVQQKQGIVKPTTVVSGMPVNDDARLEQEADALSETVKSNHVLETERTAHASSSEVVQRLAIRPKARVKIMQNTMFKSMENAALNIPSVGKDVIDFNFKGSWEFKDKKEDIAFIGHANQNMIGGATPDKVVGKVEQIIATPTAEQQETVSAVQEKKQTDWEGRIFLMGCSTGRAYREDETLEDEAKSLADKVEECYNNKFQTPITDVVGTLVSVQAYPVQESVDEKKSGVFAVTGSKVKGMLEKSNKEMYENAELLGIVQKLKTCYGLYNTLEKLFNAMKIKKKVLNPKRGKTIKEKVIGANKNIEKEINALSGTGEALLEYKEACREAWTAIIQYADNGNGTSLEQLMDNAKLARNACLNKFRQNKEKFNSCYAVYETLETLLDFIDIDNEKKDEDSKVIFDKKLEDLKNMNTDINNSFNGLESLKGQSEMISINLYKTALVGAWASVYAYATGFKQEVVVKAAMDIAKQNCLEMGEHFGITRPYNQPVDFINPKSTSTYHTSEARRRREELEAKKDTNASSIQS